MSLHPHGIQNMVSSHEVRLALAVVNLLKRLNVNNETKERLTALASVHDEVFYSALTPFRFNTSRVLIQIMKDIVRSRDNEDEQLRLIHDFQKVASGNPRIVRSFLARYFLLEMPEEWNQKTLDDHVHDSSTMGRKNPTHLVMDARVKGIRRLTVVYYHFVDPEVIRELLEAASVMGILVRIGIKYKAVHNGEYVEFIWTPRGLMDAHSVIEFLNRKDVKAFLNKGREAEEWAKEQIYNCLDAFNRKHAPTIAAEYGFKVPSIDKNGFIQFIGNRQATTLHLAEYIHTVFMPTMKTEADKYKEALKTASDEETPALLAKIEKLNGLTPDLIYRRWIHHSNNPELPTISRPGNDNRPELLRLSAPELIAKLKALNSNYRLTLMTGGLTVMNVLELLWDAEGDITHLEVLNMKEWQRGRCAHLEEINRLQQAINQKNVIVIKHLIRPIVKEAKQEKNALQTKKFSQILENIPRLLSFYSRKPLGSRFGTDSTTFLGTRIGMGLAVPETLAPSARKFLQKGNKFNVIRIPVYVPLSLTDEYKETVSSRGRDFVRWLRNTLGFEKLGMKKSRIWLAQYANASICREGNIITMGGASQNEGNGFAQEEREESSPQKNKDNFSYLNTTYLNIIKITLGFLPAFLTFMQTQSWWVLAWFGALIWFSITGIRNIIQAIIAGGGLQKGAKFDWKKLVNWSRVSDSLMFTGLSVVLLEGITRNFILDKLLGLTVTNAPLLVFSIIALANGLYICSHNIFRGFPKTAVVGNLFRSILAIPVAMLYNIFLAMVLPIITGMPAATILVPAAAIVSKLASDTVAGVIESFADRRNNYRLRTIDLSMGAKSLFDSYTRLELSFPKKNILSSLKDPQEFIQLLSKKAPSIEIECIVISLDLLYIWFYQPCAQHAFMTMMKSMTQEERLVFVRYQSVLSDYKEVSRLFLSGLLGQNFSKALAFYLDNHKDYLTDIEKIRIQLKQKEENIRFAKPFSLLRRIRSLCTMARINTCKSVKEWSVKSFQTLANTLKPKIKEKEQ